MSGLHLPQRVRDHAAERPGAPAVTWGDTTLTYAELDWRTNRIATALSALTTDGGRVGALLRMRTEGAETFVAAAKSGRVFVPLNWRLHAAEAAAIAVDAEIEVLIVESEFRAAADAVREALPDVVVVLVDAADGDALPPGTWTWDRLLRSGTATDPGLGDDPDAAVLQLYTSGTTGSPKGVVSTHRNLHNQPDGQQIYRWKPDSVALDAMPLFHIAGAGWLSTCLSAGVHVVLLGTFDAAEVAGLVARHRITHAFLVPVDHSDAPRPAGPRPGRRVEPRTGRVRFVADHHHSAAAGDRSSRLRIRAALRDDGDDGFGHRARRRGSRSDRTARAPAALGGPTHAGCGDRDPGRRDGRPAPGG